MNLRESGALIVSLADILFSSNELRYEESFLILISKWVTTVSLAGGNDLVSPRASRLPGSKPNVCTAAIPTIKAGTHIFDNNPFIILFPYAIAVSGFYA